MDTGVSPATVSRVLKRAGLSRLNDIDPAEPERRYERSAPGEMIHLAIKTPGRFNRVGHRITGERHRQSNQRNNATAPGGEVVHVAIDDHSRLSFTQIHEDEKAVSAVAHLNAAVAWYERLGDKVERVMTDNGAGDKSRAFRNPCRELGEKHSNSEKNGAPETIPVHDRPNEPRVIRQFDVLKLSKIASMSRWLCVFFFFFFLFG